jgi:hypothetical protein
MQLLGVYQGMDKRTPVSNMIHVKFILNTHSFPSTNGRVFVSQQTEKYHSYL